MKVLKALGLGILVVVILLVVISFLLPSHVQVERSAMIKASPEIIFEEVNSLESWSKFDPWVKIDPEAVVTFEGGAGVGSKSTWKSDHPNVGNGSQEIVESKAPNYIKSKLSFEGQGEAEGYWKVEEADDGANVVWGFEYEVGMNPMHRWFGLFMDGMVGPKFEEGLTNLKTYAENLPAQPESAFNEVAVDEQWILSIREVVPMSKVEETYEKIFADLGTYMGENAIQPAGAPFGITHKWTEEEDGEVDIEVGFPISDASIEGNDRIKVNKMPACKALLGDHWGDYKNLGATHQMMWDYMKQNSIEPSGAPWEVYVTDFTSEKDVTKWQTQVYYPLSYEEEM